MSEVATRTRVGGRLDSGTRLGPYEVLSFIGQGGMGEVYRARDTRLDRDVAVKILPATVSEDAGRQERFMREAWILSSLNHPNVCAIHDIGEQDGRAFLVMEFVDGEPLDVRLARRPFSLASAMSLASQIADALDAAHRRGFVHRDLKPSNIIVTAAGVKLLDFGIAKLWTEPLTTADQSRATTASDAGSVPGTTAYIAPEQLEGRPADPRSDLFAFGVVLYEMLSGRRPFVADTKAGLIAAILEKPPEPLVMPSGAVPAPLERLILKCLEKDPDKRWQTARDLSSELAWIAQLPPPVVRTVPAMRPRSHWRLAAGAASVVAAVSIVAVWWPRAMPVAARPVVRFIAAPPAGVMMAGSAAFSLSPDGRYLAFAGSSDGGPSLLWVQSLDSYAAHAIPGTDDAWHPFWSPDSRSVGFFAGRNLKAADPTSGVVRTLTELPQTNRGSFAAWGDGFLLLKSGSSLLRVAAEGGDAMPSGFDGAVLAQMLSSYYYEFLPDGRHFLFRGPPATPGSANVFVGSVDDGSSIPLLNSDSQVEYVEPGYLLFMRNGDLLAQPFDAGSRRLSGAPARVPEAVSRSRGLRAIFSASRSGVLAYEADAILTELVWFDRAGRRTGVLGSSGLYTNPALSPDGSRALVSRVDQSLGTSDIWIIDRDRGARAVTADPTNEDYPVWSADGRDVIFSADRSGRMRMYQKPADAPAMRGDDGTPVLQPKADNEDHWPVDASRDGKFVLFHGGNILIPKRLLAVPLDGEHPLPVNLFSTEPSELELQEGAQAQVSPDGHWIAYVTDLGRSPQVYVKAFTGSRGLSQVSTAGGYEPKWRGDGRELFYLAPDRTVMSVDVQCQATCTFGTPTALFRVAALGAPLRKGSIRNEYAVTRAGDRFLVNEPVDGVAAYAIRVVVNWTSALRAP